MKIFVVIPAYNEAKHIVDVIKHIPEEVHQIIVVDDCSQDDTFKVISAIKDERVKIIRHERNMGVGGSMVTGYKYALEGGADIVVKIDGDGQMDPKLIPRVISPIVNGSADYSKGFRFHDLKNLKQMPAIRLIGNIILSFLTKVVSGYWNIFDPTSGYTAIHREALSRFSLENLSHGYFFETDMLIHLYKIQAVVCDVQISNKYENEESHLNPLHISITFPRLFLKAFCGRILWRYFVIDFTAVSLFIVLGLPLFLFGIGFGLYHWISNIIANVSTPIGTVMIAVVALFFGFQFLLQALVLDITNMPKIPLQNKDKDISRLFKINST